MTALAPFKEAWTILDACKAAELKIAQFDERSSPTDCEITAEASADWYLVRTYPGDDQRAMRWLARRCFGVFRPMQQRENKRNGGKVQGMEPVFPGWIFVFCWDARKMRTRIEAAPGVMKILCYPDSDRPVPINDRFIAAMRALSWVYDEHAPGAGHAAVTGGRQARRQRLQRFGKNARKIMRRAQDLKKELKRLGKFDPSTWEQAATLAPGERISLLMRALNGPAVVGSMSSGCGG